MFLSKTYIPKYNENRMKCEGDVESARDYYFSNEPSNLKYLLQKRYCWMNKYLEGVERIIELGAGAGFSKSFIENKI